MGTKKVSTRTEPIFRLPYLKAMKALAYANRSYSGTWELLDSFHLAMPPQGSKDYEDQYDQWMNEGRQLRRAGRITPATIQKLQLDPWYTWHVDNEISTRLGDKTSRVNALIGHMTNIPLRRAVDISLYLQETPEDIARNLERQGFNLRWDASEIQIYWQFLWDVDEMRAVDWDNYRSWTNLANPLYTYLKALGNKTKAELTMLAYGTDIVNPDHLLQQIMTNQARRYYTLLDKAEAGDKDVSQAVLNSVATSCAMLKMRFNPERVNPEQAAKDRSEVTENLMVVLTRKDRLAMQLKEHEFSTAGHPISAQELDGEYGTAYDDAAMNPLLSPDYEQETE